MSEIYMYADETGDLDMSGSTGSSTYFGFGTAVFTRDHGQELWEGLQLRCHLEQRGVNLPKGLHAKNDSPATRGEVFELIRRQAPRLDATFLYKRNAYDSIKEKGPVYLYKVAWYLHFKEIARWVTKPGDTLYVIVGSLQTHNKRDAIRHALEDVCNQVAQRRTIVPCIWDAQTSWGIQVADYALWAVQRILEGRKCSWYEPCVVPTLKTRFLPWGQA
ncbi:hypothetical protein DI005_18415 [Prauserella sp. PE36]|uniref:DUF3800 domain-containing protein n=1 Tax=Prauserella sp. PE36 TaxID=1504709 RepID=UPI000DE1B1F4|nr:DUF3800 domain-containing protein [Prauserella sp. PE36]RBM18667.1 hypothetical protein DI005_18415 [Prauserella sp. PE36]